MLGFGSSFILKQETLKEAGWYHFSIAATTFEEQNSECSNRVSVYSLSATSSLDRTIPQSIQERERSQSN